MSCGQAEQPFGRGLNFRLSSARAYNRTNRLGQLRVTPESAEIGLASFAADLAAAQFLRPALLSIEELEEQFDTLSARHTPRHGFRTYDILHVASALVLGCDTFWSYDKKALRLAALEGLRTNL